MGGPQAAVQYGNHHAIAVVALLPQLVQAHEGRAIVGLGGVGRGGALGLGVAAGQGDLLHPFQGFQDLQGFRAGLYSRAGKELIVAP